MKKPILLITLILFSVSFSFANSGDKITEENINTKTKAEITLRVEVLKDRIEEIRATDFSNLERSEKKAMRKELKEIKKELKTAGSTITISVGAAIIIILLLIIIL